MNAKNKDLRKKSQINWNNLNKIRLWFEVIIHAIIESLVRKYVIAESGKILNMTAVIVNWNGKKELMFCGH